MVSDKLKEMIDKLKSKEPKKEEPIEVEVPEVEVVPDTPAVAITEPVTPEPVAPQPEPVVEEVAPAEPVVPVAPKEPPLDLKKISEEQRQALINNRIIDLRDDGLFRIELLMHMTELKGSIDLLNEVLVKLLK